MRRLLILAISALVVSCSKPTSESTSDSLTVAADTSASADLSSNDPGEDYSSYRREIKDIRSKFYEPRLNVMVADVHRPAGLHIYKSIEDAGDTTLSVGVLEYGQSVVLTEPLVNYQKGDQEMIDGFVGRYIKMKTDEGERYIFSGYLSNFPPASEGESLTDYFWSKFHLLEPPDQQRGSDSSDIYNASQYNDTYKYENGIIIEDHGYYEGSGTEITLPSFTSLQEAFLLLKSFSSMNIYADAFPVYPTAAESRLVEEGITAVVEMGDDGRAKNIKVIDETGCYDETYVTQVDGKVVISTGGGC
jgi:hypothetical protein